MMIVTRNREDYDKIGKEEKLCVRRISFTDLRSGGWEYRDRFLTERELIFVVGGSVYLTVNGKRFDIGEKEYLFLPAYCTISSAERSDAPCAFYTVVYDGTVKISKEGNEKGTLTGNDLFATELFRRMLTLYDGNSSEHPACDAFFLSFLYEISSGETKNDVGNPDIRRVAEYIQCHLYLPLETEDLCQKFHYSRDVLTKAFRSRYGIPVKRYINGAKIGAAKQLLITSRMSVEKIGNAVGYDDVSLFYKFFRYHTGVTPTVWRKQNIQKHG